MFLFLFPIPNHHQHHNEAGQLVVAAIFHNSCQDSNFLCFPRRAAGSYHQPFDAPTIQCIGLYTFPGCRQNLKMQEPVSTNQKPWFCYIIPSELFSKAGSNLKKECFQGPSRPLTFEGLLTKRNTMVMWTTKWWPEAQKIRTYLCSLDCCTPLQTTVSAPADI